MSRRVSGYGKQRRACSHPGPESRRHSNWHGIAGEAPASLRRCRRLPGRPDASPEQRPGKKLRTQPSGLRLPVIGLANDKEWALPVCAMPSRPRLVRLTEPHFDAKAVHDGTVEIQGPVEIADAHENMRKHVGSLACLKGDFWPITVTHKISFLNKAKIGRLPILNEDFPHGSQAYGRRGPGNRKSRLRWNCPARLLLLFLPVGF